MTYTRYGIYFLPPPGPLAGFGAAWVGWDVETGQAHPHFDIAGLAGVTTSPRKYGFHATLKPPFRLVEGCDEAGLTAAVAALAQTTPPAAADGLEITALGRFLALTPQGDSSGIGRVASACVTELDAFRAPPSPQELAKRRGPGLTPAQDTMLLRWGYPYVLDAFRFHITLTDRLPKSDIAQWRDRAAAHLPNLPQPFTLNAICLVGERADGQFERIRRFDLLG